MAQSQNMDNIYDMIMLPEMSNCYDTLMVMFPPSTAYIKKKTENLIDHFH